MLKKLFYLLFLTLIGAIVALPFLLTDDIADVQNHTELGASEIERARTLIRRNDPRQFEDGTVVTQWIDEEEIALIIGYALEELGGGAVTIELHPGRAQGRLSLRLPENPIGDYLNVSLTLSQLSSRLIVDSLSLGSITIPARIAGPLQNQAHRLLMRLPEYASATESLNGLQIVEDRMLVAYQWQTELVDSLTSQGRNLVVDEALKERLTPSKRSRTSVPSTSWAPWEGMLPNSGCVATKGRPDSRPMCS